MSDLVYCTRIIYIYSIWLFLCCYFTTHIEKCGSGTGLAAEAAVVLPCQQPLVAPGAGRRADRQRHLRDSNTVWDIIKNHCIHMCNLCPEQTCNTKRVDFRLIGLMLLIILHSVLTDSDSSALCHSIWVSSTVSLRESPWKDPTTLRVQTAFLQTQVTMLYSEFGSPFSSKSTKLSPRENWTFFSQKRSYRRRKKQNW